MKYDLENRVIDFAVQILNVSEQLPNNYGGRYFADQMTRSGGAPALNYGEAQSAESRRDFIHKMKLCLKELRETIVALKIIQKKGYLNDEVVAGAINENDELISIFSKSIRTAERNGTSKKT